MYRLSLMINYQEVNDCPILPNKGWISWREPAESTRARHPWRMNFVGSVLAWLSSGFPVFSMDIPWCYFEMPRKFSWFHDDFPYQHLPSTDSPWPFREFLMILTYSFTMISGSSHRFSIDFPGLSMIRLSENCPGFDDDPSLSSDVNGAI